MSLLCLLGFSHDLQYTNFLLENRYNQCSVFIDDQNTLQHARSHQDHLEWWRLYFLKIVQSDQGCEYFQMWNILSKCKKNEYSLYCLLILVSQAFITLSLSCVISSQKIYFSQNNTHYCLFITLLYTIYVGELCVYFNQNFS